MKAILISEGTLDASTSRTLAELEHRSKQEGGLVPFFYVRERVLALVEQLKREPVQ